MSHALLSFLRAAKSRAEALAYPSLRRDSKDASTIGESQFIYLNALKPEGGAALWLSARLGGLKMTGMSYIGWQDSEGGLNPGARVKSSQQQKLGKLKVQA